MLLNQISSSMRGSIKTGAGAIVVKKTASSASLIVFVLRSGCYRQEECIRSICIVLILLVLVVTAEEEEGAASSSASGIA